MAEPLTLDRRSFGLLGMGMTAAAALGALPGTEKRAEAAPAPAADTATPIKVGILHSLSGTMAISETTLKDVMLMLIEEQNKKIGRAHV